MVTEDNSNALTFRRTFKYKDFFYNKKMDFINTLDMSLLIFYCKIQIVGVIA